MPLPRVPTPIAPRSRLATTEVSRGYKQTGMFAHARVVVDADGVTVYHAHLTQVDVSSGTNRFYVVQLLQARARTPSHRRLLHARAPLVFRWSSGRAVQHKT